MEDGRIIGGIWDERNIERERIGGSEINIMN